MPFIDKVFSLQELQIKVEAIKNLGHKIVFTNGCFDIIHLGHVMYLEEAKSFGDFLIVGINSDNSVSKLKGPNRPIQSLESRMGIIASLESVDAVLSFDESTPRNIITVLVPNILVKGGDWALSDIVGSDIVISNGGSVKILTFLPGYSTSIIENKIKYSL